eukprot:CAMPEP_0172491400 /NCGR_PEP_ID=MMETSP1066-20121228/22193_1 /TAXON_ID=671091 /ORGANISM="Coscinodiscus wailesii, Strain CCMP2513" /LENGTH=375 /DNA_ID=CAMNT_0013260427 /DNA_START=334 /DNA_END=1461 /DNA_ORIENTATION=+
MSDDETYDKDSEVTREILNRFKDEKFVFVAKRKFVDFTKGAHKQYHKTLSNATHYRSPMSNNNLEDNVVYAHRITHDGHEYLAKFDADEVNIMTNGHHTKPRRPLDLDENGQPIRHLNENERGIVGDDERYKLCLRESCYPYSTIGEFDASSSNSGGGCTGTVISPSSAITAAHCFYMNGVFTNLDSFAPGRYRKYATAVGEVGRGSVRNPYGVWKVQFKTIFDGWISTGRLRYDVAIATFSPTFYRGTDNISDLNIGEVTGYMGIRAITNDSSRLQKATVTGYPYDKANGEMWASGKCVFQVGYEPVIVYHNCDSVRGNDGSALADINRARLYGVNVADVPVGQGYPDQAYTNLGVIIHESNIDLIESAAGLKK